MAPAKPSDAQAAYAVQRALVTVRIEELRAALDAHEAARPLLGHHVSDLKRVEESLTGLVAFLRRG
jgi:hypothetical protein